MAIEDDAPQTLEANVNEGATEYLLMQSSGEPAAVPLDSVLRIERIPRAQMERLNGMPVLRFAGTLLALNDKTGAASPETEMTVVVCRDGERHVGVAVEQVLDVVPGEALTEAGTEAATEDAVLLKDKVTSIVDLRRIPPLQGARPLGEVLEGWEAVGVVEVPA